MRTELDFSPLFRSSVGFDRMLGMLRAAAGVDHFEAYPPYDIEKLGEDEYRVSLAVAGFREEELKVTQQQNLLIVAGERQDTPQGGDGRQILHRGIAARAFERRFELADHVEVREASLANGMLTITLRREVPEAMRPRRIAIAGPGQAPRLQIAGEPERKAA